MKPQDSFFGAQPDRIDRLIARVLEDFDADEPFGPASSSDQVLEGPGSQIDRYKLLEVLGEGGMGVVYLAEQSHPVRRQVALKIIKPGMDSKRVLARFEAEEQALAMMEHPHIARVYDAGLAPSGRPYFVMEHVKGIPITKHCDEQRLTIEQRLHLFLHVCGAVQHAHQKGIIHRDLKPSNILVVLQDQEMIPKVIDFGIARAISQPGTERTLFTEQGQLIGTPEYMSPEQAGSSQDLDTRTDIYSLGVVLYELLAGVLPFDSRGFREGGIEHIRKVICEQDPKTPSTRLSGTSVEESAESAEHRQTDVRTLQRKLSGDLDWITLKALEKDRSRRYSTVDSLAADLRNHLDHQPVSAAPPAILYRARKFLHRHRQMAAAVGTAVLLLGILFWAVRANHQATRERHERILAEAQRLFEARGMQARDTTDPSNDALAMIQPLLTSRHVGPKAQLLFASILVEHAYYGEAVPRLQKLLDGPPEIAGTAYALLARILWENSSLGAEDRRKIDAYTKKAEELLPKTAEAYYLRAMTALAIREKLDLLGDALDRDPRHYPSLRLRALTYDASRKYKELRDDALRMTYARLDDPLGHSLLAAALCGLGDYEEAVKCYDAAIKWTPVKDSKYRLLNGRRCRLLMQMGRYDQVVTDARKCLEMTPDAAVLQSPLFCALTALGKYGEADAVFRATESRRGLFSTLVMENIFYMLENGIPWHSPDKRPEGPAFFYMFEADETYRHLTAKGACPLIKDCFSPCWSPNGTKVAFALGFPGYSGVAVYDIELQETNLLIAPGKDPSWSPDGRRIAFVRDVAALRLSDLTASRTKPGTGAYFMGEEVWVINADGSEPRCLARGAGIPSWSRDGKDVYYHSRVDGVLYSISIEDEQAEPVPLRSVSDPSQVSYPAVSPDGRCVAIVTGATQRGAVLRIIDLAERSCVAEWAAPLVLWGHSWSPDGREFSMGGINGNHERSGLWIYNVEKGEAVKVLSGQVVDASWSMDRKQLLIRLGPPYWQTWVVPLDPNISTAEALAPVQTLEEHCVECVRTCTRELEAGSDHYVTHWARTASALWIDHPEASDYLRKMESVLPDLPYFLHTQAQQILAHPTLYERLGLLALMLAHNAVQRQGGYAKELAALLEHLGQQEEAARLWQIAAANMLQGSCRYDEESDTYLIAGPRGDIWGTVDEFRFASKHLTGDGAITARVDSIDDVHSQTKVGVMIREGLDPSARFAAVFVTPRSGVRCHTRPIADRNVMADDHMATPEQIALRAPVWIRIERQGDQFSAFYSTNGKTWTHMVWSPQTVSMAASVYIGLAVTSHDRNRTAEVRFSRVTTTGNVTPAGPFTQSQDIRFHLPLSPDPQSGK